MNGLISRVLCVIGMVCALGFATGCGGRMPDDLGVHDGRLIPCPDSPNCVSSYETDETHQIEAFKTKGMPAIAWQGLGLELASLERVEIIRNDPDYVHAVFTSSLMRYDDDVEFYLRAEQGEIAVRSASRVGYGDMDANRNRIESIRQALVEKGLVADSETD